MPISKAAMDVYSAQERAITDIVARLVAAERRLSASEKRQEAQEKNAGGRSATSAELEQLRSRVVAGERRISASEQRLDYLDRTSKELRSSVTELENRGRRWAVMAAEGAVTDRLRDLEGVLQEVKAVAEETASQSVGKFSAQGQTAAVVHASSRSRTRGEETDPGAARPNDVNAKEAAEQHMLNDGNLSINSIGGDAALKKMQDEMTKTLTGMKELYKTTGGLDERTRKLERRVDDAEDDLSSLRVLFNVSPNKTHMGLDSSPMNGSYAVRESCQLLETPEQSDELSPEAFRPQPVGAQPAEPARPPVQETGPDWFGMLDLFKRVRN